MYLTLTLHETKIDLVEFLNLARYTYALYTVVKHTVVIYKIHINIITFSVEIAFKK